MCHTATTMAASSSSTPKPLNPKAQSFTPTTIRPKSDPRKDTVKKPYLPHQRYNQTEQPQAPAPALVDMYSYPSNMDYYPKMVYVPHQCSSNLYPEGDYLGHEPAPWFGSKPMSRKRFSNNQKMIARRYNNIPARLRDIVVPPRFRGKDVRKRQNNEKQRFRGKVPSGLKWRPKNGNPNESFAVAVPAPALPSVVYSPDDADEGSNWQKTSVMIRNIPNEYSRNELLEFLDKYCREYNLEYDFAYLPMDFRRHNNLGYAFVNFTTPVAAMRVHELLGGYKWGRVLTKKGTVKSSKICQITWAKFQGKDALVGRFKNSKFLCHTEEYLPVELSPPSNGTTSTVSKLATVGRALRSY